MKKLLLFICIFSFISCSSTDDSCEDCIDNSQLNASAIESVTFKQSSPQMGKVFQGSEGNYNYRAFGEFHSSSGCNSFVPKNVLFIQRTQIGTNESLIIELDDQLLPMSFYRTKDGKTVGNIFHVFFVQGEVIVKEKRRNTDGSYTTIDMVTYPNSPISGEDFLIIENRRQAVKQQSTGCLDLIGSESIEENNLCDDGSSLEKMSDWAEDLGADKFLMREVGESLSWLMEYFKSNICSNSSLPPTNPVEELQLDGEKVQICSLVMDCDLMTKSRLVTGVWIMEVEDPCLFWGAWGGTPVPYYVELRNSELRVLPILFEGEYYSFYYGVYTTDRNYYEFNTQSNLAIYLQYQIIQSCLQSSFEAARYEVGINLIYNAANEEFEGTVFESVSNTKCFPATSCQSTIRMYRE